MRFSFGFEALLNWKRNLEELSQIRLAKKMKQLKLQEEEIQRVKDQRFSKGRELIEKLTQEMKTSEYQVYKQYEEDSYNELLRKEEEKRQTVREVEAEQKELIALMKERKMLEKLKEKQFKKFKHQIEKLEQKTSDERVIVRYQSTPKEELS